MLRCTLCWHFTKNRADYLVSFGNSDDEKLAVCHYCIEDLTLLGFKANQIIRLSKPLQPKISFRFSEPIQNFAGGF
jgi:hypothetical protein